MTAAVRPSTPAVPNAPISGPKVLTLMVHLVNELDQLAPNCDRQFVLSLVTHVPVLLGDDLRTLACQVLCDARRWRIHPTVARLAAQLTTALEQLPSPDPLQA